MKLHIFFFLVIISYLHTLRAATLYRVEDYHTEAQSPFAEGIINGQITFTNFEVGRPAFPIAGTTIIPITGVSLATPFSYSTWSVDGDDGAIDGQVPSFGSACLRTQSTTRPRFVFNFTPDEHGNYPRYFGIAFVSKVTDTDTLGSQREVLGATDAFGGDIYRDYFVPTPTGSFADFPISDVHWASFFGFYNENGISQVTFKNAVCLDHLQFGYSIPEPSLLWVPVLALVCRRRRSHAKLAHNRKRA